MKKLNFFGTQERLEKIDEVCEKWENVNDLVWHKVKNNCFHDLILENWKKGFPEKSDASKLWSYCGNFIDGLTLREKYDSSIMPIISKYCVNLTRLDILFNNYQEEHLIKAFKNMKNLKYIKIDFYCTNVVSTKEPKFFKYLPKKIENISFHSAILGLTLSHNFATVLKKLKNLRHLSLENCHLKKTVMKILSSRKTLTYLNLPSCTFPEGCLLIKTEFPDLKYLNFRTIYVNIAHNSLTDGNLLSIIKKCRQLNHLDLTNCKALSISSLEYLSQLENITELYLNNIYTIHDKILGEFKNLKILECKNCFRITDLGIKKVVENSPSIEYLNINATSATPDIIKFLSNFTQKREKKLNLHANFAIVENFESKNDISPYLIIKSIASRENLI